MTWAISSPDGWLASTNGHSNWNTREQQAGSLSCGLLPDIHGSWLDGEDECIAEEAFREVRHLCEAHHLHHAMLECKKQEEAIEKALRQGPHRPCLTRTKRAMRSALYQVQSKYEEQTRWCQDFGEVHFRDCREQNVTPFDIVQKPVFLVVHLFAGRRRHGDFYDRLTALTADADYDVAILSLDTAVHTSHGDLGVYKPTWCRIEQLIQQGRVAAVVSGAPCDFAEHGRCGSGPRPVRSLNRPWGLPSLTLKKLPSAHWFFVPGNDLLVPPGLPKQLDQPSIWRTHLAAWLIEAGAQLATVLQGLYGAPATKPTCLMLVNTCNAVHTLAVWRTTCALPSSHSIGVDDFHCFRKSQLEEYPSAFSGGLAQLVKDGLDKQRHGCVKVLSADDRAFIDLLSGIADVVHDDSHFLADYHGR